MRYAILAAVLAFAPALRADSIDLSVAYTTPNGIFTQYPGYLTTQIPSLTFTNDLVIPAGYGYLGSLVDPYTMGVPYKTPMLLQDGPGGVTITFAKPADYFAANFTYAWGTGPLKISAFDSNGVTVATATSLFTNNEGEGYGEPESYPNEPMEIHSDSPFSWIVINGNDPEKFFAADDLTYNSASVVTTPEPGTCGTFALLGLASLFPVVFRKRVTTSGK